MTDYYESGLGPLDAAELLLRSEVILQVELNLDCAMELQQLQVNAWGFGTGKFEFFDLNEVENDNDVFEVIVRCEILP